MRGSAVLVAILLLIAIPTSLSAATLCDGCPEMVPIKAGVFQMGRASGGWSEPAHTVSVRAFALGRYPVTRGQYGAFAAAAGPEAAGIRWSAPDILQSDDDPVVHVSWIQAQAYAAWLSTRTGDRYRLPTEAEWEYAARAGTTDARYWSQSASRPVAVCNDCGAPGDNMRTAPVGSFASNPFGLHDMLGNVWEWVEDCFTPGYEGALSDGSARLDGDCSWRGARGGAFNTSYASLAADVRSRDPVDYHGSTVGFRVAMDIPPQAGKILVPNR